MPSKLDVDDVEALRDGYRSGMTVDALAVAFGVSERHVRRLVEGIEPPRPVFRVDPDQTVAAALAQFLATVDGDGRDGTLAAVALALASRLDRAGTRDAPALARSLVDVLAELDDAATEPDAIDLLRRRHDARRLALVASGA